MSKWKDNGEPAFPQGLTQDGPCGGLTKRDWFAGQLAGVVLIDAKNNYTEAAQLAYEFADAMIAESKK